MEAPPRSRFSSRSTKHRADEEILFQPFDLKKWFVIGFAAWLSNLGVENYNFRFNRGGWKDVPWLQDLDNTINQIPHWISGPA